MSGPEQIEPGGAPGGLVVHTYAGHGDELLAVHRMGPGYGPDLDDLARDAARAVHSAAQRSAGGVSLVVYDGDTGVRWALDEYADLSAHMGAPLIVELGDDA